MTASEVTVAAAVAAVEAAGAAGGIDEVRRIAAHGWPANRALSDDSPELRAAIQAEARRVVDAAYNTTHPCGEHRVQHYAP